MGVFSRTNELRSHVPTEHGPGTRSESAALPATNAVFECQKDFLILANDRVLSTVKKWVPIKRFSSYRFCRKTWPMCTCGTEADFHRLRLRCRPTM